MQPILLRCPKTKALVQHLLPVARDTSNTTEFEPFECPACGGMHLVNSAGKLLDDES